MSATGTPNHLVVVGGGITGLAAGYLAAKAGWRVDVLEAGPHFGGLLGTFPVGGDRLEFFYHHHFTHDAELRWLLDELGLASRLRFHDSRVGVFRDGRIYQFGTPADLLRFAPMRFPDKVRFALSSAYLGHLASWERTEGIPAYEWFERWAGQSAADSVWLPLLNIKFGPYARQVPLAWMVGRLRQRMRSRSGGGERLGYLDGSLDVLLQALLSRLKDMGVGMHPQCPVEALEIDGGTLHALIAGRRRFEGGAFLFTVPVPVLPPLVRDHDAEYARSLESIEYFGAVCVVLEMDRRLSSIYWLNVADPGFPFGGVIEHTNLVGTERYGGIHLAYLSRYVHLADPLLSLPAAEAIEQMVGPLARIYPAFRREHVLRAHVFRSRTAATVCDLHFSRRVPSCRAPVANMFLAGMPHVYPDERSCSNSIRVAAEACRVIGCTADEVPVGSGLSGKIGFDAG